MVTRLTNFEHYVQMLTPDTLAWQAWKGVCNECPAKYACGNTGVDKLLADCTKTVREWANQDAEEHKSYVNEVLHGDNDNSFNAEENERGECISLI
jgi:hypothetical protein